MRFAQQMLVATVLACLLVAGLMAIIFYHEITLIVPIVSGAIGVIMERLGMLLQRIVSELTRDD